MSQIFCDSNYTAGSGKKVSIIPFQVKILSFLQTVIMLQVLQYLTNTLSQHLNQLRLMFNAAAPEFWWAAVKLASQIILPKL
jgi:hypothetical protein